MKGRREKKRMSETAENQTKPNGSMYAWSGRVQKAVLCAAAAAAELHRVHF